MTESRHQKPDSRRKARPGSPRRRTGARIPRKFSRWKTSAFTVFSTILSFVLVEAGLTVVGWEPVTHTGDPFVGFVSSAPLFARAADANGRPVMVTTTSKSSHFNRQEFSVDKSPGTFRIFCLGGSTTYGRPYADRTSFSGWLRELLPVADPSRHWEVVNAGGISYASYRVTEVMEELIDYEPDLFIVYTGHNEFLEERTYGRLRKLPGPVKSALARMAGTRTWSAMSSLLGGSRTSQDPDVDGRMLLPAEVKAILDYSAGPERYERNDTLREGILQHYRFSLERMVRVADSVDAEVIFVTPASNLKDCSPFKSQPTAGLSAQDRARSEENVATARKLIDEERWTDALELLDEVISIDPRAAESHYQRGRVLMALGRSEEAAVALSRARDEDVCSLRALTSLQEALAEVAHETGAALLDFAAIIEEHSRAALGHGVAGEEYFLDHVHPTIGGHRLLAVGLIEMMIERGMVRPGAGWGETAIMRVTEKVESDIDPEVHARALANLALVLDWAGKKEDSRRLAMRALDSGHEDATILMIAGRHQALAGRSEEALQLFQRAVRAKPGDPVVHSQVGMFLAGRKELEGAAAHFFLSSLIRSENETYHKQLATVMGQRGRYDVALTSILKADELSPDDPKIKTQIVGYRDALEAGGHAAPSSRGFEVTRYESGYPRSIAQTLHDESDRIIDGIWTEWYDGGGLRRFVDYVGGVPHGISVAWDEDGHVVERVDYRGGARVSADAR